MEVVAYFLLQDPLNKSAAKLVPVARVVPKTPAIARASMTELLRGAWWESDQGVRSEIPQGTRLLGLSVQRGTATVNLSGEFESNGWGPSVGSRLAQVVYTLTRLPTIQRVIIHVNGEPSPAFLDQGASANERLTRDDFVDYLPSIFVDSPALGGHTGTLNGLRITGKANVFEAQFQLVVIDAASDDVISRTVHASCGTGCWGNFDVKLPLELGPDEYLRIQTYNPSARDGAPENMREYWAQAGETPKYPHDGCGC